MSILTLSGWGQPHDALASLLPDAAHFDYARYGSVEEALEALRDTLPGYSAVVGWSLGGQLASHAIAAGAKPKSLVLLAAPFQFVETPSLPLGMKRDTYDKFRTNYTRDPKRTLDKSWELVVKDDTQEGYIREQLEKFDKARELERNWQRWLHLLDGFSNNNLRFDDFPPTLIVQGERDVVVAPEQAEHYARAIPNARLVRLREAGHAPHWHDMGAVRALIKEHADVR